MAGNRTRQNDDNLARLHAIEQLLLASLSSRSRAPEDKIANKLVAFAWDRKAVTDYAPSREQLHAMLDLAMDMQEGQLGPVERVTWRLLGRLILHHAFGNLAKEAFEASRNPKKGPHREKRLHLMALVASTPHLLPTDLADELYASLHTLEGGLSAVPALLQPAPTTARKDMAAGVRFWVAAEIEVLASQGFDKDSLINAAADAIQTSTRTICLWLEQAGKDEESGKRHIWPNFRRSLRENASSERIMNIPDHVYRRFEQLGAEWRAAGGAPRKKPREP